MDSKNQPQDDDVDVGTAKKKFFNWFLHIFKDLRKDDHNERLEGEISTEKRNYKMNQMEMEILKLKNRISGLPWWHSG